VLSGYILSAIYVYSKSYQNLNHSYQYILLKNMQNHDERKETLLTYKYLYIINGFDNDLETSKSTRF